MPSGRQRGRLKGVENFRGTRYANSMMAKPSREIVGVKARGESDTPFKHTFRGCLGRP